MIFDMKFTIFGGSYSIDPIEDEKGNLHYWISDNHGFCMPKGKVNKVIKDIIQTSKIITEEDIDYYNKIHLVYVDDRDFLEKYGEDDPIWQKYGKELIEKRNKVREKKPIKGHIYFLKCLATNLYKIGYSSDVKTRIKNIQNASPTKIEIIGTLNSENCETDEAYYKNMFADKNVKGEWFALDETDLINIGVMENE